MKFTVTNQKISKYDAKEILKYAVKFLEIDLQNKIMIEYNAMRGYVLQKKFGG